MNNVFKKFLGAVSGIEVNRNGDIRRRYAPRPGYPDNIHYPKRRVDEEGNLYVIADEKPIRIDYAVASCFCYNPNNERFVFHRNGNKLDCTAYNLQWVNAYVFNKLNNITDWGFTNGSFRVSPTGEVMLNGIIKTQCDSFYERDVDMEIPTDPFVATGMFNQYRFSIDDLVATAWLKYPDQTDGIINPALLHIDGDYRNCRLDNLRWVERDSQEYQSYIQRRAKELSEEKLRLNSPKA